MQGTELKRAISFTGAAVAVLWISLPAARANEIIVSSEPLGAEVQVDDVSIGVTPIHTAGIEAGAHLVRVQLEGYVPFQKRVTLEEGGAVVVKARLLLAERVGSAGEAGSGVSRMSSETQRPRFSIGAGVAAATARRSFTDHWALAGTKRTDYSYSTYDWTWSASLDASYESDKSPTGLELTGDVWLTHGFGLGLAMERFSGQVDADASSTFDFKQVETWTGYYYTSTWTDEWSQSRSGSAQGFLYRTTMYHLMVKWQRPLAERVSIELGAGPSLIKASQEIIGEVFEFDGCRASGDMWYYGDLRATGCRVEHEKAERTASTIGFNASAAIAIALQEKLDLVLRLRYAYSPGMEVEGLDPETQADEIEEVLPYEYDAARLPGTAELKVGGLVPTVSLRYTF